MMADTVPLRGRRTSRAMIQALSAQHGRSHGDIIEATLRLAQQQPQAFAAVLAAVEPFPARERDAETGTFTGPKKK